MMCIIQDMDSLEQLNDLIMILTLSFSLHSLVPSPTPRQIQACDNDADDHENHVCPSYGSAVWKALHPATPLNLKDLPQALLNMNSYSHLVQMFHLSPCRQHTAHRSISQPSVTREMLTGYSSRGAMTQSPLELGQEKWMGVGGGRETSSELQDSKS